jgi:hypothetical protein
MTAATAIAVGTRLVFKEMPLTTFVGYID